MTAFSDAIALDRVGDAEFTWNVPPGWHQGAGAWGGLIIGVAISSVRLVEGDAARPLRTLSLQITTPVLTGVHFVTVEPVRLGSGMSTWAVRIHDGDGTIVCTATVITGHARRQAAERDEAAWGTATMPLVPAASKVPTLEPGRSFPEFIGQFDFRPVTGFPLSQGPVDTVGWIGYREEPAWDDVSLAALADGWWSVALVPLDTMPRIGTVNFTANLLVDPATVEPGGLLLHHGFLTGALGGYVSEHRRLWTSDGRLAVDNVQTIVVS